MSAAASGFYYRDDGKLLICYRKSSLWGNIHGHFLEFVFVFIEESSFAFRAVIARASQRAEAVETSGIIRPLGIAKIAPTAGEIVSAHRGPTVIGRVCAGFHHDGDVRGPGDDEAEHVALHAKAVAV